MQIIQVIPTIAYGDAVSNDTIALKAVIKSMGFSTKIYAESVVAPYDSKVALSIDKLKNVAPEDIIIYHFSTGSQLNFDIAEFKCRKIMRYHNVTPPQFFEKNDDYIRGINEWGLEGVAYLKDKVDYVLAASEFNKQDLIRMGYTCPIDVLPIIIPFDDYKKKPSRDVLKDFGDGRTNIVFTGRMAPNKKHENLIAAFYYYQKLYNTNSRLILAGSYKPSDTYYQRIMSYIERLGVKDVVITGHKKFNCILGYYKVADIFLCMSEHEGFCVPLVEAMMFDVPVLAYDTTAIGGTLGGSGFLMDDNDPVFVAGCIDKVVKDHDLQKKIIKGQRERLQDFEHDKIAELFKEYLMAFMNKKD